MNRLKKKEDEKVAQGIETSESEVENIDDNPEIPEQVEPAHHKQIHTPRVANKPIHMPPDTAKEFFDRMKELEDEVQSLRAERDDLVHEKKFWLSRFQTDNAKLATLLKVRPLPSQHQNLSF
jgi:hypothetical protein